jgi:hypothetical protein
MRVGQGVTIDLRQQMVEDTKLEACVCSAGLVSSITRASLMVQFRISFKVLYKIEPKKIWGKIWGTTGIKLLEDHDHLGL